MERSIRSIARSPKRARFWSRDACRFAGSRGSRRAVGSALRACRFAGSRVRGFARLRRAAGSALRACRFAGSRVRRVAGLAPRCRFGASRLQVRGFAGSQGRGARAALQVRRFAPAGSRVRGFAGSRGCAALQVRRFAAAGRPPFGGLCRECRPPARPNGRAPAARREPREPAAAKRRTCEPARLRTAWCRQPSSPLDGRACGSGRRDRRIDPVVRVDDEEVVAGRHDPAEARLPPQHAAHRVVLEVVHDIHARVELRVGDEPIQPRREAALGQLDAVPLVGEVHRMPGRGRTPISEHDARARSPEKKPPQLEAGPECAARRLRPCSAADPIAGEIVLGPGGEDDAVADLEVLVEPLVGGHEGHRGCLRCGSISARCQLDSRVTRRFAHVREDVEVPAEAELADQRMAADAGVARLEVIAAEAAAGEPDRRIEVRLHLVDAEARRPQVVRDS